MAKKAPSGYFYNAQGLLVKKLDAATIKAIKERFPNKTFDFNTFNFTQTFQNNTGLKF